jgi:hypothetical protein
MSGEFEEYLLIDSKVNGVTSISRYPLNNLATNGVIKLGRARGKQCINHAYFELVCSTTFLLSHPKFLNFLVSKFPTILLRKLLQTDRVK